ncbi:M23 family metallopeptidase [Inquilinus sp. CAU 1745]|uniref:M23 family metallopeptidase n=1 Tax=Inquilinus sp. CAU 1745 TaxID=3140369 RepID=UPI00325A4E9E
MILLLLILLFVCIAMPLLFAWRIWRLDERTGTGWIVIVANSLVFVLLILMVGRWDIAGYYTRFPLLALLAVATFLSWRRHAGRPWRSGDGPPLWKSHAATMLSLAFFGCAAVYVAAGYFPTDEPRPLSFPLEDGRFMVAQGGGNPLLNHHSGHPAQDHAADIVAINAAGFRTAGFQPDDPARYVVWNKPVVSPCDGTITEVRDGLPDLPPPQADPENPAGNHVIIACGGLLVELAHLRQGSVEVAAGDIVEAGQRIGAVGNSGNTTEPHLHIHAVDAATGEAVPISFGGAIPVRNRTFSR